MKDHWSFSERQWQEHFYADNQQVEQRREAEKTLEAKVFVETQRWLAEKAVIEAAGVMAYAISEIEKHSYDEYKAASNNLLTAVATLRKHEAEV